MSQMSLKAFVVLPDQAEVAIEMWKEETPLGHITLDPPKLELLIHRLAEERTKMAEEVSHTRPEGTVSGVLDPMWVVPSHPASAEKVLFLRHPGLGWLSFVFSAKQARDLAVQLGAHLPDAPPEPPTSTRLN